MKMATSPAIALFALLVFSPVSAEMLGPIEKVISMISDLEAKVLKEGEVAQKEYEEYSEWCEENSKNLGFEIKTGKAEVEELQAMIGKEASNIDAQNTNIEELAKSIASDEADLKAAMEIRESEAADFAQESKELSETIKALNREVGIVEKEMKSGSSMLQLKNAKGLTDALKVMVDASAFSGDDAKRLTALVQNSQGSDDSDAETELGATPTFEEGGSGMIDTIESLLEKAQQQLADAKSKESAALRNFEMVKQSLRDEIMFATKDSEAAKKSLEASKEAKATAEGDLSVTSADLAEDEKTKTGLHTDCLTSATDFEVATQSRGEELKALATAKKVIVEATSLSQVSFVQLFSSSSTSSNLHSVADLAHYEAVRFIRDIAKKQKSPQLAQLASRISSVMRMGGAERDVFAKVKSLINDMIAKLKGEAESEATQKAYCDKETTETAAKKEEKSTDIDKLSTKIDQMSASSAHLKEEVATLQKELADLARSQAEMDKLRVEEKASFTEEKTELEKGLGGIKTALKVLSDYYSKSAAHGSSSDTAGGIISMLEVCESDISQGLAEATSTEEAAQREYDTTSDENKMVKVTKDQDLKYKTKEFTSLDKTITEYKSDRTTVQTELDAVLEYEAKINEMCVAKAEPYAERKARREAEIAGLKEALETLEGEAVLLQGSRFSKKRSRHALRTIR